MSMTENEKIWEEINLLRDELDALRQKKVLLVEQTNLIKELSEGIEYNANKIKELAEEVGTIFE